MGRKQFDFGGWATKNDIECSDGRVIKKNAFANDDGQTVPLVWNHQHNDSTNVLGHAQLENREDGVYAYCTFNDTEAGQNAKLLVQHGDVTSLSIYANKLKQMGSYVMHGVIREVSLVLAGANEGAKIDDISFAHSDDELGSAIIFSGYDLDDIYHSDKDDEEDDEEKDEAEAEDAEENEEESEDEEMDEKELKHADSEKTVQDVYDEMTDEQKAAVTMIVGAAVKEATDNSEGEKEMKHNVFDTDNDQDVLVHDGLKAILADGKRCGTLKESYLQHADEYGIKDIDWLFPDAKNVNGDGAPGFIKRNPDAWVDVVLNGVHHTPFARIKMMFADLREDEARAKGYIKGKLKKEEVFGLLKRVVEPTTIYKKQKLDRDDLIDITDFDVVSWLKAEMRMMLDEEIARAILFGDGRTALSDDKISETNIIPVIKDADLYAIKVEVKPESGESLPHAIINAAVRGQNDYEGSGNTIFFTSNTYITEMLLMEDKDGHRLYKDLSDIALAMAVNRIVKVPASIIPDGYYGVILDLKDYNVGADKGGAVNMFDDFDIDYNQQKYLIETRCSGALVKPFSAVVLKAPANVAG